MAKPAPDSSKGEQPKRKRGRPITKVIPPIRAAPEKVAQAVATKPVLQARQKSLDCQDHVQ